MNITFPANAERHILASAVIDRDAERLGKILLMKPERDRQLVQIPAGILPDPVISSGRQENIFFTGISAGAGQIQNKTVRHSNAGMLVLT